MMGFPTGTAGRVLTRYAALNRNFHSFEACAVLMTDLRWLNTVLAVSEYRSFAKLWQEKGCSSQAETWQVKNILMKDFD